MLRSSCIPAAYFLAAAMVANGRQIKLDLPRHSLHSDNVLPTDYWSGDDGPEQTHSFEQHGVHGSDRLAQKLGDDMQLMGHYNTGTNLLSALLKLNFPDAFEIYDGNGLGNQCNFWKHSSLTVLKEKQPNLADSCKNNIGVAIVRNPLSWLSSFRRMAYDLHDCNKGTDWLTKACMYPRGTPSYLGGKSFDSVEAIWNSWTNDYDSLESFGFSRHVVVRFEDIVMDTEGTLNRIAALINKTAPHPVLEVVDNLSPTQSKRDTGRAVALEKIQNKSYLSSFSKQELLEACARLDTAALKVHKYDDCDAEPVLIKSSPPAFLPPLV